MSWKSISHTEEQWKKIISLNVKWSDLIWKWSNFDWQVVKSSLVCSGFLGRWGFKTCFKSVKCQRCRHIVMSGQCNNYFHWAVKCKTSLYQGWERQNLLRRCKTSYQTGENIYLSPYNFCSRHVDHHTKVAMDSKSCFTTSGSAVVLSIGMLLFMNWKALTRRDYNSN